MLFVIDARDRPGALEVRLATRPAHVAYLERLGDDLILAGPFLDANEKPCGSLVVVRAATLADAERIADSDPYVAANLFESRSVRPWVWAINKPEGL
jgi:uncharacterized protein YciI